MLDRIALEQWGPFASLELNLERPFLIFTGPNAVGKSWLRDAVVFALTGTLRTRRGVTQKKQIPEVAIRDGAKKASVELLFRGGLRVTRQVTRSGQTLALADADGATDHPIRGTTEELQQELYRRLGVDEARALAVLDSRRFLELEAEDRRRLLFAALGAGVTEEAIAKALAGRGLAGEDAAGLAKTAASRGFREAEKEAVEGRRAAKRALQAPQAEPAPRYVAGRDGQRLDLAEVKVEDLEARIAALERERDGAVSQHGASVQAARTWAESCDALEAELRAKAAEEAQDAQGLREALQVAHEEQAAHEAEVRALRDEIAAKEPIARGEAAVEHPGTCPVLPGEFRCPATKAKLDAHAKTLADARESAEAALAEIRPKLEEHERGAREQRERVGTLQQEEAQARAAQAAIEEAREELPTAEGEARDARERLQAIEQSEGADGSSADPEALRQRIERGREVLRQKRAYDADRERQERASAERAEKQAALERAEALARAFASDGIEVELLREALPVLQERLDETGPLLGRVRVAEDLTLEVEHAGQRRLEAQLSDGQYLALGLLLQDALGALASFPVLLFDQADLLVQETRRGALLTLQRLLGRPYGSVFVFASTEQAVPQRPPSDQVALYWLSEPGRAEAVA